MTPDQLVCAVTALEKRPGCLVAARDITEWCKKHGIPTGHNQWGFKKASDLEAGCAHRLLKFKKAPTRNARDFFARRLDHPKAFAPVGKHCGRNEARRQAWVECEWVGYWDWRNAKAPK